MFIWRNIKKTTWKNFFRCSKSRLWHSQFVSLFVGYVTRTEELCPSTVSTTTTGRRHLTNHFHTKTSIPGFPGSFLAGLQFTNNHVCSYIWTIETTKKRNNTRSQKKRAIPGFPRSCLAGPQFTNNHLCFHIQAIETTKNINNTLSHENMQFLDLSNSYCPRNIELVHKQKCSTD